MNELIKQLLAQAHLESPSLYDTNWIANRFAELLIEEVIRRTRMRKEIAIENSWKLDETVSALEADIEDIVDYHLDDNE